MGNEANMTNVPNVAGQILFSIDTGKISLDTVNNGRVPLYKTVIDDVASLKNLVGNESVATQIQNAIQNLIQGSDPDEDITLVTGITGGDGVSIDATDSSNPIIKVKLATGNNAITIDENGALKVDATAFQTYAINVTSTTNTTEKLKRYTITQGSLSFDIDIPTDMIVQDSKVVTNPTGKPAGTYLEITTTDGSKEYIDASTIVKAATAKNAENAEVLITVSADSEVSAALSQAAKDTLNLAETAVQPSDLAHDPEAKKYIAGIQVDNATGAITYVTEDLPEGGGSLTWETF